MASLKLLQPYRAEQPPKDHFVRKRAHPRSWRVMPGIFNSIHPKLGGHGTADPPLILAPFVSGQKKGFRFTKFLKDTLKDTHFQKYQNALN